MENTKEDGRMGIAINEISFLHGFESIVDAQTALAQFGGIALQLRDERVSNVNTAIDIVNSCNICANLELMKPRVIEEQGKSYSLIQALNDMKVENREQYLFVLQILTMVGETEEENAEEFCLLDQRSRFCAIHRNDFLLSIVSDEIFTQNVIEGTLNDGQMFTVRNIAQEDHIFFFWEELGFRLYEINPKHGTREYIRSGGERVGVAPESDELGQQLLNKAIKYKGKLFSVDTHNDNRIFEFRHSYANKYHAFQQNHLTNDDRKRIIEIARLREAE